MINAESLLKKTQANRPEQALSHAEQRLLTRISAKEAGTQTGAVKNSNGLPATSASQITLNRPAGPAIPADPRYVSRKSTAPDINIRFDPTVKIAHESRLHYLRLFAAQFSRIYAPLSSSHQESFQIIVNSHAIDQEKEILAKNGKGTYKQACKNVLIKLTKREISVGPEDMGIHPHYKPPLKTVTDWEALVHSPSTLEKWGYTMRIPEPDATMKNEEGSDRICDRCLQRFVVSDDRTRWLTCTHHPGKSSSSNQGGNRVTKWTCCDRVDVGCTVAPSHVFKITHPPRLAAYTPYVRLPSHDSQRDTPHIDVVALDCEMVYTTASMELARISVTSKTGDVLLDELVAPENTILDLNTRYSGIQEQQLLEGQISREELFQKLDDLGVSKETIIVGHGLENDLTAMRIVHDKVIDSAILFPHPRGRPYRNALKYLVKRYLNKDIQMNPASGVGKVGHDPAEDARSALELIIWKASHGDEKVGDVPFTGKLK
ncbi:RNA exonuclease 3 [Taphrina deformans PYCC 5710]|uniref:RNA exonuclease 3 n=1 Tax=Taphrina deformans (strain PYCC 5710 / ATCC 11124 / CBS 356.35 / IMI 108563 / JCM 9778 / NBRC 8474) TaxID=1097556 RepID=R4XDB0_TAPDE|nr:RNA exonuclease 3 [Taphrina deformans PYCC 5710]|eukprot:CCG83578.1 RNA exonuclease 3 [Taphrina deformans PYCC 5710]